VAGFAGSAWSKHLSWVRRRRSIADGVVARIAGATPWKRLQALSGAFNASGSDLGDPSPVSAALGEGAGKAKSVHDVESGDSVPRTRPINAQGLPGMYCGHGRDVLEGTLTSVDLLWLAAGPSGSS
jgi:hypothetical protein